MQTMRGIALMPSQAISHQGKPESLLRIEEVQRRTGIGRTEIYEKVRAGAFPKQVKVGRLSLWVDSEIDAWVRETIASFRSKRPGAAASGR